MQLIEINNPHWQVGILPQQGGSLAYGRMRISGTWFDVLRPTPPPYSNPSSFLMLPWANRIRDGVLRYKGQTWQLRTTPDDGTARHGDVRKRAWQVIHADEQGVHLRFESDSAADFNFPFRLIADAHYFLEDTDWVWRVSLTNADTQPFPAGFGFHPYFVRHNPHMPMLHIPCEQAYTLTDAMPTAGAHAIPHRLDFREPRPVPDGAQLDDLLTARTPDDAPLRLIYRDWHTELHILADALYSHVILFNAADGSLAVEPQTNANDGFNLFARGVAGSGIFELAPQETVQAAVRLRLVRR